MEPLEIKLAPSILTADFSRLKEQVAATEAGGADLIHLDVMDGNFVPNLTFGAKLISDVKKHTSLPLDAHLMVHSPENYFESFQKAGVSGVTVHQEAVVHLDAAVAKLKSLGLKAGVAINPATGIDVLKPIIPELDLVLVMTVNPGFGNQKLIPYTIEKIKNLRELAQKLNPTLDIEVDGGWKHENAHLAIEAGANVIVAGSAIFNQGDIKSATEKFKSVISKA